MVQGAGAVLVVRMWHVQFAAIQLAETTGIRERSLATVLSAMKRDGFIEPVGGKRGSFQYGLTPEGRSAAAKLWIEVATEAKVSATKSIESTKELVAFMELEKALVFAEDLRLLLQFVRWLVRVRSEVFDAVKAAERRDLLEQGAMEFIGIDSEKLAEQRAALDAMLSMGF